MLWNLWNIILLRILFWNGSIGYRTQQKNRRSHRARVCNFLFRQINFLTQTVNARTTGETKRVRPRVFTKLRRRRATFWIKLRLPATVLKNIRAECVMITFNLFSLHARLGRTQLVPVDPVIQMMIAVLIQSVCRNVSTNTSTSTCAGMSS